MSARRFASAPVYPTGSGGTVKIMDFVLSSAANLQAAAIPQTFTHLLVLFTMQSARAGFSNTGARFRVNGASSNYDFNYHGYHFSSGGNAQDAGYAGGQGSGYLGQCPAAGRANDNNVARGVIDIPFYRDGNFKHSIVRASMSDGAAYAAVITVGNQFYGSNAPITQLDLMDDVGSALGPRAAASLYGIA